MARNRHPARSKAQAGRARRLSLTLAIPLLALAPSAAGEPVAARLGQGASHGFLVLSTTAGEVIADGHFLQTSSGGTVTTRVSLAFADGSVHDEAATFTQDGFLQLESFHGLQRGPSFPRPIEDWITRRGAQYELEHVNPDDAASKGGEGIPKPKSELRSLPADVSTGLMFVLLQELPDEARGARVNYVSFTPKPRLLELDVERVEDSTFGLPLSTFPAAHYVLRPRLGPLVELAASLADRTPAPIHVWLQRGESPTFVRMEGALYAGGPTWILERTGPRLQAR